MQLAKQFELRRENASRDQRMVQIKEMLECSRFGLGEVTYESLLRLFHGDSVFVRIREMSELGRVELERVHCCCLDKVTVVSK